jgi:hypothetical protein
LRPSGRARPGRECCLVRARMPGFAAPPDLINTAFEEKGRHTRMIYTNPVMPLDCTSLVILFAEIE